VTRKRANGQGSIWQSNGVFRVAVVAGYDESGKAIRLQGSAATKEAAEKLKISLQYQAAYGKPVTSADETIEHFLTRWLEDVARPSIRYSSYIRYRDLTRSVLPHIGRYRLCDFRPTHLQQAYAKLTPRYAPSTISRLRAVLHNAFHDAVGWDLIAKNPVEHARVPKVERRKRIRLTAPEGRKLFDAAGQGRWRMLWWMLAATGMRLGEALDLEWSCIRETGIYIPTGKTDAAERWVPNIGPLRTELKLYEAWQTWYQRDPVVKTDLVFRTGVGTRICNPQAWRAFKSDLARAGLPDIRPHDLRGTYINWCREAGIDLDVVRVLVGHADLSTTDRHYLTITESRLIDAAARLETFLQASETG